MKNIQTPTVLLIIVLLAIGGIVLVSRPRVDTPLPPPNEPSACTAEAMICPDGSAVGRSGPHCEFTPCPPAPSPTSPTSTTSSSVIRGEITGTVLYGPTCPVEQNPPEPACADKPYSVNLEVTNIQGTKIIKNFSSNAQGMFTLSLPVGEYAIRNATNAVYPRCSNEEPIKVFVNKVTQVRVSCDSGIR
jgi:hypothetical protein